MTDVTSPKPFVFVLMPFDKTFDDIYQVGIKQACKDAGAYCERVDEQIYTESILERVYNQIAKADIIVADMTGRNPNVFYETGYAHALSKRVILLTQNADDIPFDLKHYPHIVYGTSIAKLKAELESRIHWCIEHPKTPVERIGFNLEFFIDGVPLINALDIKRTVHYQYQPGEGENFIYELEEPLLCVSVHNPINRLCMSNYKLGLVMPQKFPFVPNSSFKLPDGTSLYIFGKFSQIFPDGWENYNCKLENRVIEYSELPNQSFQIAIRIFTETGTMNFLYCSPKTGHKMAFKTEYFGLSLVEHATAPQTPRE